MKVIKAPNSYAGNYDKCIIFLAGSIEMGAAPDWQAEIAKEFEEEDVVFLNPRRDDWNKDAKQSITDPYFSEQVNWELDGIGAADSIVFYFAPGTMSPISLLELGLVIGDDCQHREKIFVCCPDGFWRKGNVEVVCDRAGVDVHNSLDELKLAMKKELGFK